MTYEPSALEILSLWRLAVAGGGDWKGDVKPALKGSSWDHLADAGLIEQEKRSAEVGKRKRLHVSLTDRGWQWLSEHLDAPIATRSPASLEVLVRLLSRLRAHLNLKGLALAEFIQSRPGEADASPDSLDRKIETAYLSLTEGRPNVRVRLADLRDTLSGVPREEFDATLLNMATSGTASLYRLDNPLEISSRDRDAILRTPSGEERHVVYLGGRGS